MEGCGLSKSSGHEVAMLFFPRPQALEAPSKVFRSRSEKEESSCMGLGFREDSACPGKEGSCHKKCE